MDKIKDVNPGCAFAAFIFLSGMSCGGLFTLLIALVIGASL